MVGGCLAVVGWVVLIVNGVLLEIRLLQLNTHTCLINIAKSEKIVGKLHLTIGLIWSILFVR